MAQCGGFAKKPIWVTAFDPSEKYASGDYPNVQAGGDGLPKYVAPSRPIENADEDGHSVDNRNSSAAKDAVNGSCCKQLLISAPNSARLSFPADLVLAPVDHTFQTITVRLLVHAQVEIWPNSRWKSTTVLRRQQY